jgi:SPP1 family predicted phage head-tail adaptor
MNAGRLNRRCMLQQPGTTQDALGQPVAGWVDVGNVWASAIMKNGLSALKSDSPTAVVQVAIRVRYRSDIAPGMRFLHNLVPYKIMAVMPDVSGRVYVDCVCEVVN